MALRQGSEALSADLQPVVDDYLRLQGAHHVDQLRPPPGLAPQLVIGKIKPQDIQLSVVFAKLPHLPVHIIQIAVKIPAFVRILRILPHGMIGIAEMRIIRMVPVQQRMIESDLQTDPALKQKIDILIKKINPPE